MQISSLKEAVEAVVRQSFEKQINEVISQLKANAQAHLDAKIAELKVQAKKEANSMALEILQKANLNGISLELKL